MVQAEIRKLKNQVQLLPHQKLPRPAKETDVLLPLDAVRTGDMSMVELLFDRGKFLRIGSNSLFRFAPRKQQLRHLDVNGIRAETLIQMEQGVALVIVPSELGQIPQQAVQIDLPQSLVSILPTASPDGPDSPADSAPITQDAKVLAMHDDSTQTDYVIALSDKNIHVSDLTGNQSMLVPVGHLVAIANGQIQPPQPVDPKDFIRDSKWKDFSIEETPGPVTDSPQLEATVNLPKAIAPLPVSTAADPPESLAPVEPSLDLPPLDLPSAQPSTLGSMPRPEGEVPPSEPLIEVPVPQKWVKPTIDLDHPDAAEPGNDAPKFAPPLFSKPSNNGFKPPLLYRVDVPESDSLLDDPVEPPIFVPPDSGGGSFPAPINWEDDEPISSIPEPSPTSGLLMLPIAYLACRLLRTRR
jgi:hypothetical protein